MMEAPLKSITIVIIIKMAHITGVGGRVGWVGWGAVGVRARHLTPKRHL